MTTQIIRNELIQLGATVSEKTIAIKAAGELLAKAGRIAPAYIDSLLRRETVANTFLGHGVAIPHGMIEDRHLINETGIAILQVPEGVEWNPGQRVHLVIAIAAQSDEHIALLRRLTRLLQDEARLAELFTTADPYALISALDDSAVAPAAPQTAASDLSLSLSWQMNYPNGLHARPARLWTEQARRFAATLQIRNGNEVADAKNLIGLLQIGAEFGHQLHFSADGPDAAAALDALLAVANQLTAQEVADADAARKAAANAKRQHWQAPGKILALRGISASPGLVIGQARVMKSQAIQVPDIPATLGYDGDLLENALQATREQLQTLAADTTRRLGKTEGSIFLAQAELLSDTDLITLTCQLMVEGHGVAWAWHEAVQRLADRLAALGNPLLAARATDLRDVGRRVLARLAPDLQLQDGAKTQGHNEILIANDLAPSDTATLNPQQTLALVTAQGGPTSHTAILARTLDLPAVVAAGAAVLDIQDGATLIVDGDSGTIYLNASDEDLASAQQWQQAQRDKQQQAASAAQQPAVTADGARQIEVAANVNRPEQVAAALQAGAEGVGLMRTEFLFLERDDAPDEEEQYQTYRGMLTALDGKPLVIRTLDIGGDKQVPYLNLPHEENPFLGVRGVRLLLRRPDLLLPQLRALYRAASHGPLSIMFPMVSTLAEVKALRAQCEQVRVALNAPVVPLGIMVEVPAAATMADRLAEHVDFFSVGTNDLTQYVLAIDRQHPELAAEADSLHPAVLRLIAQTVAGADAHGRWVGVCGGMAGDPLGAAILTGLGVAELSMSPRDIPGAKASIRAANLAELQQLAQRALNCDSAAEVRALTGATA
ncbi:PTS fructose transporter subunit IIA [Vogesella sp. EB]|uniref:phosphoenolpyruvate--protein phosphotransferase n=1 Tax=Vogesella sp. EB TaxID=1526735 RepID=UPI00064D2AAF|nr:phosphoenolpyruvate--protein phosphotransferase [Vogesella sp. EB]KMJ54827.1 PTS fructose transporter subunit IIA [Vogesella sp. EB]